MGKQTFRITFFVRKSRIGKNGLAPILARITINGIAREMNINCIAYPEKWDQAKERAKGKDRLSNEINACLDDFRSRVLEVMNELHQEGCEGNTYDLIERLKGERSTAKMFLAEFADYCQKKQKEADTQFITQLTANKYHRLLRYMREYTTEEYQKDDISLTAVNHAYLVGLNVFMQTRHNCKNNGAVNLLCCLKNFILYCERNEWIDKNPFQFFKMKIEKTTAKAHLTKKELESMIAKKMPNDRLERIRDVFAFCCLTGLAFTDVQHLKDEHITRDEHGNLWAHKPREKTGVMSRIPLLPHPVALLKKYERDAEVQAKGKLLPVPSNQKMNAYLKELATICNFDKTLTTHCARHTFACLAVEYGMPIDIVAKVLGHNNVNMTRHYAKFSENRICKEMFRLNKELRINSDKEVTHLSKAQ